MTIAARAIHLVASRIRMTWQRVAALPLLVGGHRKAGEAESLIDAGLRRLGTLGRRTRAVSHPRDPHIRSCYEAPTRAMRDHKELVAGAAEAVPCLAAGPKGRKVIKDADLSALFGIELDSSPTAGASSGADGARDPLPCTHQDGKEPSRSGSRFPRFAVTASGTEHPNGCQSVDGIGWRARILGRGLGG